MHFAKMKLSHLAVTVLIACSCTTVCAQTKMSMRKIADYCVLWKTGVASEQDMKNAERTANQALERTPGDWGALYCKANIYGQKQEWKQVIDVSKRLEAIAGTELEQLAAYQFLRTAYHFSGDPAESKRYFSKSQPIEKKLAAEK